MTIYWPGEGEYQEVEDDEGEVIDIVAIPHITVKWMLDGCTTFAEAASRLRETALEYEQAAREGWRLEGAIADGTADLLRS